MPELFAGEIEPDRGPEDGSGTTAGVQHPRRFGESVEEAVQNPAFTVAEFPAGGGLVREGVVAASNVSHVSSFPCLGFGGFAAFLQEVAELLGVV